MGEMMIIQEGNEQTNDKMTAADRIILMALASLALVSGYWMWRGFEYVVGRLIGACQ